jgi:DNA-binding NarL/FixJ family response regulator
MVMQKAETNSKVKRALPQGLLQVTFLTAKTGSSVVLCAVAAGK